MYAVLSEYDAALYASNIVSLPIILRFGGSDETVPPWNFRRMSRVLKESGMVSEAEDLSELITVSEVPGKGHWW